MTIVDFLGPRIGAGTAPVTPDPVTAVPRRLVTGLVSRSKERTQNSAAVQSILTAGVKGGQVLEIQWRTMQPEDGPLNEPAVVALKADLDWAHSLGLGVLIRVFAGFYAPDWARAAAGGPSSGGGMPWYTNDGALAVGAPAPTDSTWKLMPRPMPIWWDPGYAASYAEFIAALAAEPRIMEHPALCGMTMSGPMTQYAEPMVKQFARPENRQNAVDAGYTPTLDQLAFASGFEAHAINLNPLRIATYCAYNDYQLITLPSGGGTGIQTSSAITIALMEKQVSVLGRMAVIENNSLQVPTTKYPDMYARQRQMRAGAPPVPLHYQTETLPKHEALWDTQPLSDKRTSPSLTVQQAIAWGAMAVELPSGSELASVVKSSDHNPALATAPVGMQRWAAISPTDAASMNFSLRANVIGLDEFHGGTTAPPSLKSAAPKRGWVEDGSYASQNYPTTAASSVRLPPTSMIDAGMHRVHLNVGLNELVDVTSTGLTTYRANSIESRIANVVTWNAANPTKTLNVHLRIHTGIRCPLAWYDLCGSVEVADSNFGKKGKVPIWWTTAYRTVYAAAMDVLAPVVDGIEIMGSVNIPAASFFYPEPFLRFPTTVVSTGVTNGSNMIGAGYTADLDKDFLRWVVGQGPKFQRTVVYLALNPAPFVSSTGGSTAVDMSFLYEIGNAHIAAMPAGHAGLENYSLREDYVFTTGIVNGPGNYQDMYDYMVTKKSVAWISGQLARPHQVAQTDPNTREVWDDVATGWELTGAHAVETTGGSSSTSDPGTANIWPTAYLDNTATITSQDAAFRANPGPAL